MNELDKMENRLQNAQNNLDRLKHDKARAEAAVMTDPGNQELAIKAAALDMQIKAAEIGLNSIEAATQAERQRMTSPQAKAELKRLDKANQDLDTMADEIHSDIKAVYEKMETWLQLQKESNRLARKYNKPFHALGPVGSRLSKIKMPIGQWLDQVHSWKRHAEITANGISKPANNKQPVIPLTKRDKMLSERYPVKKVG